MSDPMEVLRDGPLPGFERFWPEDWPAPLIRLQFERPQAFVRAVEMQIPKNRPGIYVYCDEAGRVIYVGKAICLRKRLLTYARGRGAAPGGEVSQKEGKILKESRFAVIGPCLDELGALVWERELIATWKPKWNRSHNLPPRRWLWLTVKTGTNKPFQMRARPPAEALENFGPFRGGRFTSSLKRALNEEMDGLPCSERIELAKSFLRGKQRTYLKLWECHLARVNEANGVGAAVDGELRESQHPGPLERFEALLAFERWRVKVARSKTLTGYCPIDALGPRAWNCSLPPGFAYFYYLREGRIMGAIQAPLGHPPATSSLPREFFVREKEMSIGPEESLMVGQWLDRFPACAQSFVFAQTTLFSNSAGSA